MDFDLDDPLGDLLSDGSNDSFFGTSKKNETKKPASANQTSGDVKSKSKVADLFGIDSEVTGKSTEIDTKSNPSSNVSQRRPTQQNLEQRIQQSIKQPTPTRTAQVRSTTPSDTIIETSKPAKKETRFDDSDDFLNELGFDPKHPKGSITGAKKSAILDDILNFGRNETVTKPSTPITKPSTPITKPTPSTPSVKPSTTDVDKRASKPTENSQNRYSPSLGRSRNLPRSGSGGSIGDPLGLFSKPEPKKEENTPTATRPKSSKKSAVDWLGLDTEAEGKTEEIFPVANEEVRKLDVPKLIQNASVPSIPPSALTSNIPTDPPIPFANVASTLNVPIVATTKAEDLSANLNLINRAALENEQALHALQHQKTQLHIASQMKQQENMLHDMHSKQQALIKLQENQFNELLRRQIDRQNQLETQIHQQQEQINAYISVLMNQPSIASIGSAKVRNEDIDDQTMQNDGNMGTSRKDFIELQADVKRLELEKLRLEDTLQSVQTAHEQELELLHMSHKKQIALLEENLESLEKRLREEIKSTENYHLSKINALQTEMETKQIKHDEQIEKLITDYEKQIEKLRMNYEQDLEALKNDQRSTIENIRQAKLFEFAALQESGSYLNTLKSASDNLEHATDNLQSMRTNIDSTIERMHNERDIQLEAKEKRLNELQKNIDKNIERTEEERNRLIELVKSLEIKLNSIEQNATEEQWSFRQKSASLEAEKVSFEREKTFTREKLQAEEKRIQELKDNHLAEHKRLLDLLDAERQQILVEKAKLETLERLKMPSSNPLNNRQGELDAAIKIAQDAAKSAEIEREKSLEQQRRNEVKRHELMEKESHLQTQQNELELQINQAKDQKQIAEHATKTCKALEQKLLTKLQSLQNNYIELTERETKLSEAKMELGKERMELQRLRQQLRQSKCSLCRIGAQNREISELDPMNDILNDKPFGKLDFLTSNSFDGLQQRLSNVETMIDDVVINIPQLSTPMKLYNLSENLPNPYSLPKSVMDQI